VFIFEDIGFRPMEWGDLELVRQMHNEPSTLLQLGDPTPVSEEQQRAWFKAMSERRSDIVFVVCRPEPNEIVGVWRLQNVDQTNRVCEVGVDIFPQYRRQGLAVKTYQMLLTYLFDHFNMHMAYLRVAEFNENAIALYEKVGFRETGRLKESIFRHGRYFDNIIFCLTAADYRAQSSSHR
jgi:RimJ/RimL family protein N-acetyltransferase